MLSRVLPHSTGPRALTRSLAWLRLSAIIGQCVAIFVVARALEIGRAHV